jgi:hypothetical protein
MAKGVGQQRELAPGRAGDGGFEPCAGVERVLNGGFDVVDDEVEVHRGPMTLVAAGCATGGGGAGWLEEEVDGRGAAEHFDAIGSKPTSGLEAEGGLVETDGLVEVIDVDIDEEWHRSLMA